MTWVEPSPHAGGQAKLDEHGMMAEDHRDLPSQTAAIAILVVKLHRGLVDSVDCGRLTWEAGRRLLSGSASG